MVNEPQSKIGKSNKISLDACVMLVYAADDLYGQILKCTDISGKTQRKGIQFIKNDKAREIAIWISALEKLSRQGYIKCAGSREILMLTNNEYIFAD